MKELEIAKNLEEPIQLNARQTLTESISIDGEEKVLIQVDGGGLCATTSLAYGLIARILEGEDFSDSKMPSSIESGKLKGLFQKMQTFVLANSSVARDHFIDINDIETVNEFNVEGKNPKEYQQFLIAFLRLTHVEFPVEEETIYQHDFGFERVSETILTERGKMRKDPLSIGLISAFLRQELLEQVVFVFFADGNNTATMKAKNINAAKGTLNQQLESLAGQYNLEFDDIEYTPFQTPPSDRTQEKINKVLTILQNISPTFLEESISMEGDNPFLKRLYQEIGDFLEKKGLLKCLDSASRKLAFFYNITQYNSIGGDFGCAELDILGELLGLNITVHGEFDEHDHLGPDYTDFERRSSVPSAPTVDLDFARGHYDVYAPYNGTCLYAEGITNEVATFKEKNPKLSDTTDFDIPYDDYFGDEFRALDKNIEGKWGQEPTELNFIISDNKLSEEEVGVYRDAEPVLPPQQRLGTQFYHDVKDIYQPNAVRASRDNEYKSFSALVNTYGSLRDSKNEALGQSNRTKDQGNAALIGHNSGRSAMEGHNLRKTGLVAYHQVIDHPKNLTEDEAEAAGVDAGEIFEALQHTLGQGIPKIIGHIDVAIEALAADDSLGEDSKNEALDGIPLLSDNGTVFPDRYQQVGAKSLLKQIKHLQKHDFGALDLRLILDSTIRFMVDKEINVGELKAKTLRFINEVNSINAANNWTDKEKRETKAFINKKILWEIFLTYAHNDPDSKIDEEEYSHIRGNKDGIWEEFLVASGLLDFMAQLNDLVFANHDLARPEDIKHEIYKTHRCSMMKLAHIQHTLLGAKSSEQPKPKPTLPSVEPIPFRMEQVPLAEPTLLRVEPSELSTPKKKKKKKEENIRLLPQSKADSLKQEFTHRQDPQLQRLSVAKRRVVRGRVIAFGIGAFILLAALTPVLAWFGLVGSIGFGVALGIAGAASALGIDLGLGAFLNSFKFFHKKSPSDNPRIFNRWVRYGMIQYEQEIAGKQLPEARDAALKIYFASDEFAHSEENKTKKQIKKLKNQIKRRVEEEGVLSKNKTIRHIAEDAEKIAKERAQQVIKLIIDDYYKEKDTAGLNENNSTIATIMEYIINTRLGVREEDLQRLQSGILAKHPERPDVQLDGIKKQPADPKVAHEAIRYMFKDTLNELFNTVSQIESGEKDRIARYIDKIGDNPSKREAKKLSKMQINLAKKKEDAANEMRKTATKLACALDYIIDNPPREKYIAQELVVSLLEPYFNLEDHGVENLSDSHQQVSQEIVRMALEYMTIEVGEKKGVKGWFRKLFGKDLGKGKNNALKLIELLSSASGEAGKHYGEHFGRNNDKRFDQLKSHILDVLIQSRDYTEDTNPVINLINNAKVGLNEKDDKETKINAERARFMNKKESMSYRAKKTLPKHKNIPNPRAYLLFSGTDGQSTQNIYDTALEMFRRFPNGDNKVQNVYDTLFSMLLAQCDMRDKESAGVAGGYINFRSSSERIAFAKEGARNIIRAHQDYWYQEEGSYEKHNDFRFYIEKLEMAGLMTNREYRLHPEDPKPMVGKTNVPTTMHAQKVREIFVEENRKTELGRLFSRVIDPYIAQPLVGEALLRLYQKDEMHFRTNIEEKIVPEALNMKVRLDALSFTDENKKDAFRNDFNEFKAGIDAAASASDVAHYLHDNVKHDFKFFISQLRIQDRMTENQHAFYRNEVRNKIIQRLEEDLAEIDDKDAMRDYLIELKAQKAMAYYLLLRGFSEGPIDYLENNEVFFLDVLKESLVDTVLYVAGDDNLIDHLLYNQDAISKYHNPVDYMNTLAPNDPEFEQLKNRLKVAYAMKKGQHKDYVSYTKRHIKDMDALAFANFVIESEVREKFAEAINQVTRANTDDLPDYLFDHGTDADLDFQKGLFIQTLVKEFEVDKRERYSNPDPDAEHQEVFSVSALCDQYQESLAKLASTNPSAAKARAEIIELRLERLAASSKISIEFHIGAYKTMKDVTRAENCVRDLVDQATVAMRTIGRKTAEDKARVERIFHNAADLLLRYDFLNKRSLKMLQLSDKPERTIWDNPFELDMDGDVYGQLTDEIYRLTEEISNRKDDINWVREKVSPTPEGQRAIEEREALKRYKAALLDLRGVLPNVARHEDTREELTGKIDALTREISRRKQLINWVREKVSPTPEGRVAKRKREALKRYKAQLIAFRDVKDASTELLYPNVVDANTRWKLAGAAEFRPVNEIEYRDGMNGTAEDAKYDALAREITAKVDELASKNPDDPIVESLLLEIGQMVLYCRCKYGPYKYGNTLAGTMDNIILDDDRDLTENDSVLPDNGRDDDALVQKEIILLRAVGSYVRVNPSKNAQDWVVKVMCDFIQENASQTPDILTYHQDLLEKAVGWWPRGYDKKHPDHLSLRLFKEALTKQNGYAENLLAGDDRDWGTKLVNAAGSTEPSTDRPTKANRVRSVAKIFIEATKCAAENELTKQLYFHCVDQIDSSGSNESAMTFLIEIARLLMRSTASDNLAGLTEGGVNHIKKNLKHFFAILFKAYLKASLERRVSFEEAYMTFEYVIDTAKAKDTEDAGTKKEFEATRNSYKQDPSNEAVKQDMETILTGQAGAIEKNETKFKKAFMLAYQQLEAEQSTDREVLKVKEQNINKELKVLKREKDCHLEAYKSALEEQELCNTQVTQKQDEIEGVQYRIDTAKTRVQEQNTLLTLLGKNTLLTTRIHSQYRKHYQDLVDADDLTTLQKEEASIIQLLTNRASLLGYDSDAYVDTFLKDGNINRAPGYFSHVFGEETGNVYDQLQALLNEVPQLEASLNTLSQELIGLRDEQLTLDANVGKTAVFLQKAKEELDRQRGKLRQIKDEVIFLRKSKKSLKAARTQESSSYTPDYVEELAYRKNKIDRVYAGIFRKSTTAPSSFEEKVSSLKEFYLNVFSETSEADKSINELMFGDLRVLLFANDNEEKYGDDYHYEAHKGYQIFVASIEAYKDFLQQKRGYNASVTRKNVRDIFKRLYQAFETKHEGRAVYPHKLVAYTEYYMGQMEDEFLQDYIFIKPSTLGVDADQYSKTDILKMHSRVGGAVGFDSMIRSMIKADGRDDAIDAQKVLDLILTVGAKDQTGAWLPEYRTGVFGIKYKPSSSLYQLRDNQAKSSIWFEQGARDYNNVRYLSPVENAALEDILKAIMFYANSLDRRGNYDNLGNSRSSGVDILKEVYIRAAHHCKLNNAEFREIREAFIAVFRRENDYLDPRALDKEVKTFQKRGFDANSSLTVNRDTEYTEEEYTENMLP